MATKVLSATIQEELSEKLNRMAKETHRKKSYFVNEALKLYFEEMEDIETAQLRRGGKSTPISEAKKLIGI